MAELVEEQAHAAEVDLELGARLSVRHSDRERLAAKAELADAEAVQGSVRHPDAAASEQAVDLGQSQVLFEPLLQPGSLPPQLLPARTVLAVATGTQRLRQRPQQLVTDLLQPAAWLEAGADARLQITPHGLAVRLCQAGDRPHAVAHQPQPQHLSDFHHGDLPEHPAPPLCWCWFSSLPGAPRVVPSFWLGGGP